MSDSVFSEAKPDYVAKSPHEILTFARALLENPDRWTTGVLARGPDGSMRYPSDADACKFCVAGAMMLAVGGIKGRPQSEVDYRAALMPFKQVLSDGDWKNFPGTWNDTINHATLLAALDKAVAKAQESQP